MNKGGTQKVAGVEVTGWWRRTTRPALDAGGDTVSGGEACGFVVTLENGFKIYHAGDTNVFLDMPLIRELYAPDLACLPIGGHYTMGPREAAKACELLAVPRVVPMHWGTFPVLSGTPEALREEIAKRKLSTEVVEMSPGGVWPR